MNSVKNLRAALVAIALVLALGVSALAQSVVVTGTNVRLRLGPSLNAPTLTNSNGYNIHPQKGEYLTYLGQAGDFYYVNYGGYNVYISKQYARYVGGGGGYHNSGSRFVVVDGVHVRLRLAPSLNSGILTNRNGNPVYPAKGARLRFLGHAGDFYRVSYNGNTVYIHKAYSYLQ